MEEAGSCCASPCILLYLRTYAYLGGKEGGKEEKENQKRKEKGMEIGSLSEVRRAVVITTQPATATTASKRADAVKQRWW